MFTEFRSHYAVCVYRIRIDLSCFLLHPLRRQKEKALQKGFTLDIGRAVDLGRRQYPVGYDGGVHSGDTAHAVDLGGRRSARRRADGIAVGFLVIRNEE